MLQIGILAPTSSEISDVWQYACNILSGTGMFWRTVKNINPCKCDDFSLGSKHQEEKSLQMMREREEHRYFER
jgi:hypothetical protein